MSYSTSQIISESDLRKNYETGEQDSAEDRNKLASFVNRLESDDLVVLKHLKNNGIALSTSVSNMEKLVEEYLKDQSGYDATKTQSFIQETGTLKWGTSIADGNYDGDLLYWDNTDEKWKNMGISPSKGQLLVYGSSGWELVTAPPSTGDYALVSEGGTLGWRELGCETTT